MFLAVCVCLQNNLKTYGYVLMQLTGNVDNDTETNGSVLVSGYRNY